MHSKQLISVARWCGIGAGLAAIVIFYRLALHSNTTTIALTLLLFILFVATQWGLRYAIVLSFAAGLCYNYFFLPPVGHFTISDPQNILALFVFLITSIVASRMSDRIREESKQARQRQEELEILYRLSRALLQTDEIIRLTNSIPNSVANATGATAVLFYLIEGDRIYRSGADWTAPLSSSELRELSHAPGIISSSGAQEAMVPLRTGVRPHGVLIIRGARLSHQGLEALGGLVSIALDRSSAIHNVSRANAAKESERLRGLMLNSITHELGNPLTFINSSLHTLLGELAIPQPAQKLLASVHEESSRLSRLVSEAVEMAQFDTQEVHMTFTPQRLDKIVNHAIEANKSVLAGYPVSLTLPPNLPLVEVDPVWIQKLLGNLLENAAQYSTPGAPIFVTAELRGDLVACSVADRGLGIEPLEQSLIFDKFLHRRNPQSSSGTGLGLAICRTIVEAHGGSIGVTSQPGKGSVFTFTLRTQ